MTHYPNGFAPDVECKRCDGTGEIYNSHDCMKDCPDCCGHGWRPMTEDEIADAAERQAEDAAGEPPVTMAEMHRAAWAQKMELRR